MQLPRIRNCKFSYNLGIGTWSRGMRNKEFIWSDQNVVSRNFYICVEKSLKRNQNVRIYVADIIGRIEDCTFYLILNCQLPLVYIINNTINIVSNYIYFTVIINSNILLIIKCNNQAITKRIHKICFSSKYYFHVCLINTLLYTHIFSIKY